MTVAVPLAGWAIASSSPLMIPSYVFNLIVVPALLMPTSDAAEAFWSTVHAILAYGIGVLILLHAAAALDHHLRKRDRTLGRMLPHRKLWGRQSLPAIRTFVFPPVFGVRPS